MKAIKQILCLGLVLILFLHSNYIAVYYSLHAINTEELTASCCEKIVLNCNAHCYLDKKINEQNDNNTNGTFSEIRLKISDCVITGFVSTLYATERNNLYSFHNFSAFNSYFPEIDHPPQV